MTKLIVKPIDFSQPGSYKERKRFMRLLRRLSEVRAERDMKAVLSLFDEADDLLLSRIRTDDGSPVEDALDALSANQFDALLSAITFESGVGEANAVPSTSGTEGTGPSTPNG